MSPWGCRQGAALWVWLLVDLLSRQQLCCFTNKLMNGVSQGRPDIGGIWDPVEAWFGSTEVQWRAPHVPRLGHKEAWAELETIFKERRCWPPCMSCTECKPIWRNWVQSLTIFSLASSAQCFQDVWCALSQRRESPTPVLLGHCHFSCSLGRQFLHTLAPSRLQLPVFFCLRLSEVFRVCSVHS